MEIVSKPFNGKNYWKKNGYTLLNGSNTKRKIQVVKINGDGVKTKRFWRMKKAPKLLMAVMRPKKLWEKLRDGYMSMMVKMSGDVGRLNGGNDFFVGKRIAEPSKKVRVPSKQQVENFENRLVLEIYKALATSRGVSEL